MRYYSLLALVLGLSLSCATNRATGKKVFLLTSEGQENQQGEAAYRQIQKQEKEASPEISRRIEELGRRIAAVSGRPDFQWEFRTFDNATPNAFCLPGGKVGVYTGILSVAQNEGALAAVIGHEIGHALARHGGQRVSEQMASNILMVGVGALAFTKMAPPQKQLLMAGLGAGLTVGLILPFSRSQETEADEIGLKLMAKAGYDPHEAVNFWDRFSKVGGKKPPAFLSTHPSDEGRREHLRELLPEALDIYSHAPQKFGQGRPF